MIGIAQVLAMIDLSANEGAFSITFVKQDGTLRTIERAQKGIKKTDSSGSNNFKYNIKNKGVVHVADIDATNDRDKWRTIKISRIIEFNGQKVKH